MALLKHATKDLLDINVYDTEDTMGRGSADYVSQLILDMDKKQDEINILFSTAVSQKAFLKHLLANENIPWEKINVYQVDEYIGLDKSDSRTLKNELLNMYKLRDMNYNKFFCFDPEAKDEQAKNECEKMRLTIEKHPIDICIAGFGNNGHIAFNEPGVGKFDDNDMAKVIKIAEASKKQQVSSGNFESEEAMPDFAYTMTIPALMSSKHLVSVVPFINKAKSSHDAVMGPVDESCPASIVRRHASSAAFFDKDSASLFIDKI